MSASQIKIMEPGAVGTGINGAPLPAGGEGERLVVITGHPANINLAVQMLYHVRVYNIFLKRIANCIRLLYQRLEQEKQKQLRSSSN